MICSSGGLSYNTANWKHRFRVAPIPYKYADNKTVISQGANICMTNKKNYTNASKVIKALTSGEFQAAWCLETGYYPCSKSAVATEAYQNFLKETTAYPDASATRIAYREGSKLNSDHYMSETEGWVKFVDPAFKGSSILRTTVKGVLESVFSITGSNLRGSIKSTLDSIENVAAIQGETTIKFVH
jgi:ABC-type glycerol-3-phosphate transport system substrate-binding protein